MLTDSDLERFARHLSLPEIGAANQERLLALRVEITSRAAWSQTLRRALNRAGVDTGAPQPLISVVDRAEPAPARVCVLDGVALFGAFRVPPVLERSDPLDPLAAFWLGTLLASELILWHLSHRPAAYGVELSFPHERRIDSAV
jgi:hypothetical protein